MTEPAKALAERLATAKSDLERQAWWRDRVCGDPKTPWLDKLAWWVDAALTILAAQRSAPVATDFETFKTAWYEKHCKAIEDPNLMDRSYLACAALRDGWDAATDRGDEPERGAREWIDGNGVRGPGSRRPLCISAAPFP